MKKKYLSAAIAGAIMAMSASALANPVTDADDPAYIVRTAVPDAAKAKSEAATMTKVAPFVNQKLKPAVDKKATPETIALYRYLDAIGKSGDVIYGHENDAHHKMFRAPGGNIL